MCFDKYIGIRGECKDAKLYIDDLPGINIENASDIAESFEKPQDIVDKSFDLALDQVYNDWINQLKSHFDYKEIFDRYEYRTAGKQSYYTGQFGEVLTITLLRSYNYLTKTKLKSIGIVSQAPAITSITIEDVYGREIHIESLTLKAGYNKIELDIETPENELTVKIPLNGITIGSNDKYFSSLPCPLCICESDCIQIYSNIKSGFDINGTCVVDRCALMQEFWNVLKTPILYKTGINFFLHVKGTNRINSYTRNSKEQVDYFLNLWQGGVDTITGIKTNSAYWQALKVAAESTVSSLRSMHVKPFMYNATEICNHLP